MKTLKIIKETTLSIVLVLSVAACATVMNGDWVSVPVYTTPSHAKVTLNGVNYTTPAIVQAPRGMGSFYLQIEKEGYQPVNILLQQSLDGWLWGNVLIGGLIGVAIDFISGDAYDLEPEIVNQQLQAQQISKSSDGGLTIVLLDINDLPQKYRDEMRSTPKEGGIPLTVH